MLKLNKEPPKMRKNPKLRKDEILQIAVEQAKICGYTNITREAIANQANISMGLITYYFETMNQLKRAVIRYAIRRKIMIIIVQGIINNDSQVRKISSDLRRNALSDIMAGNHEI